jgi:hypothetical protein
VRRRGGTLAELVVAAPIGLWAVGIGTAAMLALLARTVTAVVDPRLVALSHLDRLRREVRTARAVLYPPRGHSELCARALVIRTRDGELVAFQVQHGVLQRLSLSGGERVELMRGATLLAVRRLGGDRPRIRLGVARGAASPLLTSALLIGEMGRAKSDGTDGAGFGDARDGSASAPRDDGAGDAPGREDPRGASASPRSTGPAPVVQSDPELELSDTTEDGG